MPPFIGQGLGSGVRDAANLAWRLAQVVQRLDDDALLDGYQHEPASDVRAMTTMAPRAGRVVQTRSRVSSALLRAVLRTAGALPGLEPFVSRRGQPARRLPRVTAGPHPDAGRLLPDAGVRMPGGDVVRLDDLLNNRWAVIGYGEDPRTHLDADARAWTVARRAAVLAIAAPGQQTPVEAGCAVVERVDGVLPAPRRPAVTIVRPDRFLLGTFPAPLTADRLRNALPTGPPDQPPMTNSLTTTVRGEDDGNPNSPHGWSSGETGPVLLPAPSPDAPGLDRRRHRRSGRRLQLRRRL
jgi:3-(3-hydroxy-phenyl)propionate hydroxylase